MKVLALDLGKYKGGASYGKAATAATGEGSILC
jgi:hypothetical protein